MLDRQKLTSSSDGAFETQDKVLDLQVLIIKMLIKKEGYYDYDSRKDSKYDQGGFTMMEQKTHNFGNIELKQRFVDLTFTGVVQSYYGAKLQGANVVFEFSSLDG